VTTVVFETASLASAFAKAASVAPTTGMAFDKAAGIVLEILPAEGIVRVKSTNLDIFYAEWIKPLEMEGDETTWRIPSKVFASVISTLPIGPNKTVKMYDKDSTVHLESGRMKLNRQLILGDDYPEWSAYDPSSLAQILDFGGKYERVMWAASKDNLPPMTGAYLGNGILACTNRFRICMVPMETPFDEPVVFQGVQLGPLVKPGITVGLGRTDTQLLLSPDPSTQLRIGLLGDKFPPVTKFPEIKYPQEVAAGREDLVAMLTRTKHVVGSARDLYCTMYVGREEVAFSVKSGHDGLFGDVVDVPGAATHARVHIKFNQNDLANALSSAPGEMVTLAYNPENMMLPMRISSGDYQAWVSPIKNEES